MESRESCRRSLFGCSGALKYVEFRESESAVNGRLIGEPDLKEEESARAHDANSAVCSRTPCEEYCDRALSVEI